MEEALKRKLNRRNKKKGDEAADPAAQAAEQDSGKPQPEAGNPEERPMQGMVAASAKSVEVEVCDSAAGDAAAEAKSSESAASSPPLTFQLASDAVIDAQVLAQVKRRPSCIHRARSILLHCPVSISSSSTAAARTR